VQVQLGLLDEAPASGADSVGNGLTVRESKRARHLILQLVPPHTLEVVVPRGTRPREIEAFVVENRRWIERTRQELAQRFGPDGLGNPDRIELAALGETFEVVYEHGLDRARWRSRGNRLTLGCRDPDFADAPPLLRAWLIEVGRRHLKPWLAREAARFGLAPRNVQIRLQRTRWGSCSWQGTISLNASLLLVEPDLVRYLMIHELSHLRWLDHSRRYWALVKSFEPDYKSLDRRLSETWASLPLWLVRAQRGA
jgi:predicted metal-dependent hydrolase